jgi:hypothetical protein
MTDLNLLQAIAAGEILYSHRGVDYVRLCAVFALPIDSGTETHFYALDRDWPSTPIGELALRDLEIARLQQRLAAAERERDDLQQALTRATAVPPTIAVAATGMAPPEPMVVPAAPPAERHYCAPCDREFPSRKSLMTHNQRKHSGRVWSTRPPARPALVNVPAEAAPIETPSEPAAEPEPPKPRIQLVEDNPDWRCASCGKSPGHDGAFSRSVTRPDLCFKCAAQANSAPAAAAQLAA